MITRPRVTKPDRLARTGRPWSVDYPVNRKVFTGWFLTWRDAMAFACFVASTSKAKT